MELEKIMKTKIILFTNDIYFYNFENILLKLAYEINSRKSLDLLTDRIEKKKKINLLSNWFYIMKLLFSKTSIPDYSEIKNIENKTEDNIIKNLKSYEIDKLQYYYLKNIGLKKLKKLNFLSVKLKMSLINITQIYSNLCKKEIIKHKNNSKDKDLLLNRTKRMSNINKKYFTFRFGNRDKTTKMNHFFFNNILKN